MAKGGKAKALQNGRSLGMSLHKFATAKRSKYDKRARLEKKAALNAGRINKYRKLKQRLLAAGQTAQSAVEHEVNWCMQPNKTALRLRSNNAYWLSGFLKSV